MEDYLPRAEPVENRPPKSHAKKTLILWVLLILMVVALYNIFSAAPPHETAPPPSSDGGFSWWSFFPVAMVALFVGLLWWQFRGGTQLTMRLEPGLLALADGQLQRAIDSFGEVARHYGKQIGYAVAARANLAHALMRAGQLQKAQDEFIAVERTRGIVYDSEVRVSTAIHLSWIFALRGDLERAQKWSEESRKRLAKSRNRTWAGALSRVAETFVAARKGALEEAARLFDGAAPRLEAALSVTTMRSAWLMRAFVAAQLSSPREANAEPWLRFVRGARADEIAYLWCEWPELAAFVETSGVLR